MTRMPASPGAPRVACDDKDAVILRSNALDRTRAALPLSQSSRSAGRSRIQNLVDTAQAFREHAQEDAEAAQGRAQAFLDVLEELILACESLFRVDEDEDQIDERSDRDSNERAASSATGQPAPSSGSPFEPSQAAATLLADLLEYLEDVIVQEVLAELDCTDDEIDPPTRDTQETLIQATSLGLLPLLLRIGTLSRDAQSRTLRLALLVARHGNAKELWLALESSLHDARAALESGEFDVQDGVTNLSRIAILASTVCPRIRTKRPAKLLSPLITDFGQTLQMCAKSIGSNTTDTSPLHLEAFDLLASSTSTFISAIPEVLPDGIRDQTLFSLLYCTVACLAPILSAPGVLCDSLNSPLRLKGKPRTHVPAARSSGLRALFDCAASVQPHSGEALSRLAENNPQDISDPTQTNLSGLPDRRNALVALLWIYAQMKASGTYDNERLSSDVILDCWRLSMRIPATYSGSCSLHQDCLIYITHTEICQDEEDWPQSARFLLQPKPDIVTQDYGDIAQSMMDHLPLFASNLVPVAVQCITLIGRKLRTTDTKTWFNLIGCMLAAGSQNPAACSLGVRFLRESLVEMKEIEEVQAVIATFMNALCSAMDISDRMLKEFWQSTEQSNTVAILNLFYLVLARWHGQHPMGKQDLCRLRRLLGDLGEFAQKYPRSDAPDLAETLFLETLERLKRCL